jgi:hypothetical protein
MLVCLYVFKTEFCIARTRVQKLRTPRTLSTSGLLLKLCEIGACVDPVGRVDRASTQVFFCLLRHHLADIQQLSDATADDVQLFGRDLFARMYIETLVHGNMDEQVRMSARSKAYSDISFRGL